MAIQNTVTQSTTSEESPSERKRQFPSISRIVLHIILIIGAAVCIFPFFFMIIKSLSTVYEATQWPPVWFPKRLMFLNYSVAWSRVSFGPTVKIVERGSISYAYIEFWAVLLVLINLLIAGLLVSGLGRRSKQMVQKPALSIALFVIILLPSLYLIFFGVPCRLETRDGYLPTTAEGDIQWLQLLGYDRNWTYQPPPEYLTSQEADRSLTPVIPISVGEMIRMAGEEDHDIISGNVMNTVIVAAITVPAVLITSILAAYAFAWLNFWGKDVLFILFLSTMMIPFEAILIPNYIIVAGALGWHDTFQALSVPFFVSVFNIFLLRQFFRSIPKDYYDAARLDGASNLTFLRHVVLPMSQSPIAVVTLFTFLGVWNSFQWPLIIVREAHQMIQVGMSAFRTDGGSDPQLIMAAATFTILPVVILYFLTQKTFIESVASSGLKG
jgi:ABC-type glycerol-3-phosphate transport system permease component